MVQNPPRFLESFILALADDPQTAAASVSGLERLTTPRAKAKLAELSAAENLEGIRQIAVTALGELGDPAYCPLMLGIAQESREYSRFIALRAAGYLCGEEALPLLMGLLGQADASSRHEAAYALGNSHSREAVPLLISLLLDADPNVSRTARDSLATLTHRRSKTDEGPTQAAHRDWTNWWASNGATVPIYRIDDCVAIVPFVNWFTEVQHEDPLLQQYDLATMGDPEKNKALWEDRSPINFIQNIRCPLMLLAGGHDPRCPREEADQVAEAVRTRGGIAEYQVYENEGHGFSRLENQIDSFKRIAAFLNKYVK